MTAQLSNVAIDVSKHPLIKQAYEVCQTIEKCGASPELTRAGSQASALMQNIANLLAAHEQEPVAYSLIFKNMDGVLNSSINTNTTFATREKAEAYGRGGRYETQHDGSLKWVADEGLNPVVVPLYANPAPVPAVSTREKLAALQLASIINDLGLPENAPFVEITSEIFRLKEMESTVPAVPDEISTTDAMKIMNGRIITMSLHTAYKNGWNACRAAMLNGGKS